jgi:hypothetical protein
MNPFNNKNQKLNIPLMGAEYKNSSFKGVAEVSKQSVKKEVRGFLNSEAGEKFLKSDDKGSNQLSDNSSRSKGLFRLKKKIRWLRGK